MLSVTIKKKADQERQAPSESTYFMSLVSFLYRQMFHEVQKEITQPAITSSKLKIQTLEQGVKYIQS